jgi:hypothetical protein
LKCLFHRSTDQLYYVNDAAFKEHKRRHTHIEDVNFEACSRTRKDATYECIIQESHMKIPQLPKQMSFYLSNLQGACNNFIPIAALQRRQKIQKKMSFDNLELRMSFPRYNPPLKHFTRDISETKIAPPAKVTLRFQHPHFSNIICYRYYNLYSSTLNLLKKPRYDDSLIRR